MEVAMREFEFTPVNTTNKWDARPGRVQGKWELNDLKDALAAHARLYDVKRTRALFREATGVDADAVMIDQLPHRFYGLIIAWCCTEIITKRPHKVNHG